MPASPELDSLRALQSEVENFLQTLRHPVVVEDAIELFDLTAASWRLRVEFGKLLLEVWNPARSIVRRVEEIAYRNRGRLGLFVRKPGGRQSQPLELRDLERGAARHVVVVEPGVGADGFAGERLVERHKRPEEIPNAFYPDVVVFAVKPQAMEGVLKPYKRFGGR